MPDRTADGNYTSEWGTHSRSGYFEAVFYENGTSSYNVLAQATALTISVSFILLTSFTIV